MKTGNNRGQVLVILALGILALLGVAALAIDVGFLYTVRNELQRSADAGALAGASYFKETGYWSNSLSDPQMQVAEARAKAIASRDVVVQTPLDPSTEITVSLPSDKRIRVDTRREVSLYFAGVLGIAKRTVTAYAVAEAYPVSQNVTCVVPFGIPIPWVDSTPNGDYDPGEMLARMDITKEECDTLGSPTVWDSQNHVISGPKNVARDSALCQGSLQILKIGDSNTLIPGNFFGMDFADLVQECPGMEPNHGASFYKYMINHSCDCTFKIGVNDPLPPVPTEPGKMVGPTREAIAPNKYWGWTPYTPGDPPVLGTAWPQDDASPYYYSVDSGGKKDWIPGNPPSDQDTVMNGDPDADWVYNDSSWPGGYPDGGKYSWNNAEGSWQDSPRVLRIPLYDPSGTLGDPPGIHTPDKSSGKTSFTPIGFVGFWVQDIQYFPPNSGTVVGRFITVGGWGSGSGTNPGPTGAPVLNIRLVE